MFLFLFFFFFNDTATTEIYTVPYTFPYTTLFRSHGRARRSGPGPRCAGAPRHKRSEEHTSELQSHGTISYAVFCLKKKKKKHTNRPSERHIQKSHTHKN